MLATESSPHWPVIIQGGLCAASSGWRLANAVARRGHLGVVSGVGLDTLLVRRLHQDRGSPDLRRGMAQFPLQQVVDALDRLLDLRKGDDERLYPLLPLYRHRADPARQELIMLAAFMEVWLAREGHTGPVGINLLTGMQPQVLASLYGAMLAGVDYVLMDGGLPRDIPGCLDALAQHQPAKWPLEVAGLAPSARPMLSLDPREHWYGDPSLSLKRPRLLARVDRPRAAPFLMQESSGRVDGLIARGVEPAAPELDIVRKLGVPFWLSGVPETSGYLPRAREAGAAGVRVETLFTYCDESGIAAHLKRSVLAHAVRGAGGIPAESPEPDAVRERTCDLGYLREAYLAPNGGIEFRCAGQPVAEYLESRGRRDGAAGSVCQCNALFASAGYPQQRRVNGEVSVEPPAAPSNDDLARIGAFLAGRPRYGAGDVLDYLLAPATPCSPARHPR